jgi:hypothetical protein
VAFDVADAPAQPIAAGVPFAGRAGVQASAIASGFRSFPDIMAWPRAPCRGQWKGSRRAVDRMDSAIIRPGGTQTRSTSSQRPGAI